MPKCGVYLYDDALNPISSQFTQIEIQETRSLGLSRTLDIQTAGPLGNEFGAEINLPVPPEPICVWIDDASGGLGPASLSDLNGKLTARLDVILYGLPSIGGRGGRGGKGGGGKGGGGKGGGVGRQIVSQAHMPEIDYGFKALGVPLYRQKSLQLISPLASYIDTQIKTGVWSQSEGSAVRSLVETVMRAISIAEPDSKLLKRLERWSDTLEALGINIVAHVNRMKKQPMNVGQEERKPLAEAEE